MIRADFLPLGLAALSAFASVSGARAQRAAPVPPSRYELIVNGESFQVEANRQVKLQSKQKPGTTYTVALRVAPTQVLRLNHVQFSYDWLAEVTDDRGRRQRRARLSHELGYSLLITDLGDSIEPAASLQKRSRSSCAIDPGTNQNGTSGKR